MSYENHRSHSVPQAYRPSGDASGTLREHQFLMGETPKTGLVHQAAKRRTVAWAGFPTWANCPSPREYGKKFTNDL